MSLRLVEILVPEPSQDVIESILDEQTTLARWRTPLPEEMVRLSVLVRGDTTEAVLQALEGPVADITDARVLLLAVEATLPRPDEIEEQIEAEEAQQVAVEPTAGDQADDEEGSGTSSRLSTAELYQDVLEMSDLTGHYVGLVLLSTVVAAFGLLNGSIIAIIGAMVIAPLIGPNVGLSMATTLADVKLARASILTSAIGVIAALAASLVIGAWLPVDPSVPELAGRTTMNLLDLGLALAAGAAAALSLTVGVSTALVGVMVAVALLPPIAAAGLLAGAGDIDLAIRAALLAASNLICINLAGVLTFLAQGIRPTTHWEAERARQATVTAIVLWIGLMAILVYLIWSVFGVEVLTAPAAP